MDSIACMEPANQCGRNLITFRDLIKRVRKELALAAYAPEVL